MFTLEEAPQLIFEKKVDAKDLNTMLSNLRLNFSMIISILLQVATAINHIHKKDMVHGNLCSKNILISTSNNLQIYLGGFQSFIGGKIWKLDNQNLFDLKWIAPEKLKNQNESTKSSDVYSFGILIHELITKEVQKKQNFDLKSLKFSNRLFDKGECV